MALGRSYRPWKRAPLYRGFAQPSQTTGKGKLTSAQAAASLQRIGDEMVAKIKAQPRLAAHYRVDKEDRDAD